MVATRSAQTVAVSGDRYATPLASRPISSGPTDRDGSLTRTHVITWLHRRNEFFFQGRGENNLPLEETLLHTHSRWRPIYLPDAPFHSKLIKFHQCLHYSKLTGSIGFGNAGSNNDMLSLILLANENLCQIVSVVLVRSRFTSPSLCVPSMEVCGFYFGHAVFYFRFFLKNCACITSTKSFSHAPFFGVAKPLVVTRQRANAASSELTRSDEKQSAQQKKTHLTRADGESIH